MSKQSKPGKQSVNLAAGDVPVSRIRRDPPPAVRQRLTLAPDERDRWVVVIGVVTFALTLFVLALAFGSYSNWRPWQYNVQVSASE